MGRADLRARQAAQVGEGELQRVLGRAGAPLLLVIEDLHWADPSSRDVLRFLLARMRQEPLLHLQEIRQGLIDAIPKLPEEEAITASRLLNGGPAGSPAEASLADQVAMNKRLLESVIALDKLISQKLGGDQSFYRKFGLV